MLSTSRYLLVAATFILSSVAGAQSAEQAAPVGSQGPALKFNTDSTPVNTDTRQPLKFKGMDFTAPAPQENKASSEGNAKPVLEFSGAEEEGFKSYIGYPRHEIQVTNGFDNISAKWGYNGQDFNFRSSTVAYGLNYTFVAAPMWKLGLFYSRYNVSSPSGTVAPYAVVASDETLDQYGLNGEYCLISSSNFYRQFCAGGTIMNDAYPILKFTSSTRLEMGKVDDIVVGIHLSAQLPFTDKFLFKPILGFNYGTGAGQSGALTADKNSKFYFRGELPWLLKSWLTLRPHVDYSARQALIKGKIGNNNDKWETDSTVIGGGIDAIFQFQ